MGSTSRTQGAGALSVVLPPASVKAPEDLALAERCVAGDRASQQRLFHGHKRRMHATLYRVLGSNAYMDDLLQEAFMNVFRSLRLFRGESSLATWIDRCTVRVAWAHIAQRKARAPHLELVADVPAGDASAEDRVLAREAARRLYAELDKMDPKQRLAFTLHVIDGRPLSEVAELMEATLVATKTRVLRARRSIVKRARRDPALASFVPAETRDDDEGPRESGVAQNAEGT
jgi:RNA polymerase sigma-70 factor (ECF subfamily)